MFDSTLDCFYCPPENILGDELTVAGEEFSHLVHVMRKKIGDRIRIVDGKGNAYDATLTDLKKKTAHGRITAHYTHHNEPNLSVTLAVGVLKNPSRFDFLVEKTTELGIHELIPLTTERVIPHHAKIERWQKLALAAMKQCGRSYLPNVRPLTGLDELLGSKDAYDAKLIAHEKHDDATSFKEIIPRGAKKAILLIGPEGGFSENEVSRCVSQGFVAVSLGNRRLRTETAAILITGLVVNSSSL
jgi:16S rRNA (uracil1498-N3)-methyltransferase